MYKSASFACQLVLTMMDINGSFQHTLQLLTALSNLPLIIFTWTRYLLRRVQMVAFFNDWKKMEEQLISAGLNDCTSIQKVRFAVYTLYTSFGLCFFFSFVVILITSPQNLDTTDIIFYYYPRLTETNWVALFRFFMLMTGLNVVVFFTVIDLVPVLVYLHFSKMIEALRNGLVQSLNQDQVNNYEVIHLIWSHFEKLRVMMQRADDLFGPILILNHGVIFFIICATTFSILNIATMTESEFGLYFPIHLVSTFLFPSRLLLSVHLILKVHSAAERLLSIAASLSTQHWKYFDEKGQRVLHSFLCRLQHVKLAACPSGFYKITPSILLTMLSLIISYTIILLQNK